MKKFDLNIEQVLENWEVYHALREIIANALDEQTITQTEEIQIKLGSDGTWRIRDFGRGLQYIHFTQNENQEKLSHPNLIGRFGVGLKDAMATFDRHGIGVEILSQHGRFTLGKSTKHAFEDVMTLHAYIEEPLNPSFKGTEFILTNVPKDEVQKAKQLFLVFSNEEILSTVQYGEILKRRGETSNIYINGVKVAEEENFLFSYNITSLTKAMKKELNRERTNVGRTAYSTRVKQILLENQEPHTTKKLVESLNRFTAGEMPVELSWKDVAIHSCKILNAREDVIFMTPSEAMHHSSIVDDVSGYDYRIVTIPDNLSSALANIKDITGNPIRDIRTFVEEMRENLTYKVVPLEILTKEERSIWNMKEHVLGLISSGPNNVTDVKLVDRINFAFDRNETLGLWQGDSGTILIARSQLSSLEAFAGTLLHERAHASSGRPDVDRGFEFELTDYIGKLTSMLLQQNLAEHSQIELRETSTSSKDLEHEPSSPGFFERFFGSRKR